MKNWLNDTARDLNHKIYKRRSRGPSITTIYNWQQEWRSLGLDFKISFYEYKKKKLKEWYERKRK
jgi:transposase